MRHATETEDDPSTEDEEEIPCSIGWDDPSYGSSAGGQSCGRRSFANFSFNTAEKLLISPKSLE